MTRREEWLTGPLPADVRRALDRLERAPDVARVVVLPDVHLSADVCIGTAVATHGSLYPAAVGGDIGCGMTAVRFDTTAERVEDREVAGALLRRLTENVPILRHPHGGALLPESLAQRELSAPSLENAKRRLAALQLGTLGRGNHFIELQADEENALWLMVHTGSRGMGQAIRAHHERRGERVRGGLQRLDVESAEGRAYLADVAWALDYAAANRARIAEVVEEQIEDQFGVRRVAGSEIDCHHNFVRLEEHTGESLWVHRKGATSARAGEAAVIPGSMGTMSFHVEGRGEARSLCTSSHGAGRRLARGEAMRLISTRDLERELRGVFFDERLASKLRDEAPGAYKDIGRVMRAQKSLVRVRRRLRPLVSYKGV